MSPVAKAAHGEDSGRCNFLGHIPCQCAEDEEKKKVRAKLKKLKGQMKTLWGTILLLLTLKEPMLHGLWQTNLLTKASWTIRPLDGLLTQWKQPFFCGVCATQPAQGSTQYIVQLLSTTAEMNFFPPSNRPHSRQDSQELQGGINFTYNILGDVV